MRKSVLIAGVMASAVVLSGVKTYADDAFDIESFSTANQFVTYDNQGAGNDPNGYPVITAVGSQPGVFGGHTYTGWSVFAADSTGSLDLFASQFTLTNITHNSSSLAVGDGVSVGGQWGPFHQIPELSFITTPASNNYFNVTSTGNTVPTAPIFTISQLNATGSAPSNNTGIAGFYLEVDNVTISSPSNGFTVLPSYTTVISQETYTVTDNTGSMTMFDWTTSYSAATMLSGTPIGVSNTYDVEGFVSYNTGGPLEFTPLALQAVPEPSTLMLAGLGLVGGVLAIRRRRS